MNAEKKTPLQIIIRVLVILGLLILLLLLTFGIIKLVPKALNGLTSFRTSLFSIGTPPEKILISSEPASFTSESDGIITWTQTGGKADGYYTFQYACGDNKVIIQKNNLNSNSTREPIACDQPYAIENATTTEIARSFPIHIINSTSEDTTETLTISHRKPNSNNLYTEASLVINIYPASQSNTQTTPSYTSTSTSVTKYYPPVNSTSTSYSNPSYTYTSSSGYRAPADLAISITRLGIIDPSSNRFVETSSSPNLNERSAVQFQVTNIGGRSSGPWRFVAYMPTNIPTDQIYYSGLQSSIPAGKTSYFTIGFYAIKNGTNEFRIVVDPQNSVPESNKSNNQGVTYITHN